MTVDFCKGDCSYDEFKKHVETYIIDESELEKICNDSDSETEFFDIEN